MPRPREQQLFWIPGAGTTWCCFSNNAFSSCDREGRLWGGVRRVQSASLAESLRVRSGQRRRPAGFVPWYYCPNQGPRRGTRARAFLLRWDSEKDGGSRLRRPLQGSPELPRTSGGTNPRARARLQASPGPRVPRTTLPKGSRAWGLRRSGEPHHRASPEERRVPADSRGALELAAARATPPTLLPLGLTYHMHQSPHVLVSSPQVCAKLRRLPAGAGRARGGAPGQWAPGPGGRNLGRRARTRRLAASPWSRRGIQRRAAALSPAPAMPAARRSAQPSALRPVRRPPTARPPRPLCSLTAAGQWARGAEPVRANGRALGPGGAEVLGEAGRGGLPGPFPSLPRGPEVCAPLYLLRPWRLFLSSSREAGIDERAVPARPGRPGLERRGAECCGSSWDPLSSFSLCS